MEYFHGYIEEIAGVGSVVNKHYFISGHERVEDRHSGILMNYNEFASLEQELNIIVPYILTEEKER